MPNVVSDETDAGSGSTAIGATETVGEEGPFNPVLKAGLLLVDERRGRRIAMERGLEVTGLLGVLAEAKARGFIPQCQPLLDKMICVAGFWIGDELRLRYLKELKELD